MDSFSAPAACLANSSLTLRSVPLPEPDLQQPAFPQLPAKKVTRSSIVLVEDVVLPPAGYSGQTYKAGGHDVSYVDSIIFPSTVNGPAESPSLTPTRDTDERAGVVPPCPSRSSLSASYPPTQESSPRHLATQTRGLTENTHLDWPSFMHAYAHGRWDPHRTPHRPRSSVQVVDVPKVPHTDYLKCDHSGIVLAPSTGVFDIPITNTSPPSSTAESPALLSDGLVGNPELYHTLTVPASDGTSPELQILQKPTLLTFPNPTSALKIRAPRPMMPLAFSPSSYRLRNSFSSSTSTSSDNPPSTTTATNTELQTTVATMRWAAAKVDISPLALPSPEHELADPMRGITTTIPGAHPVDNYSNPSLTPGGSRRSRLTEFWEGTNDVEEDKTHRKRSSYSRDFHQGLEDAEQLPQSVQIPVPVVGVNCITGCDSISPVVRRKSNLSLLGPVPPATAPSREIYHASDISQGDYFGNMTFESTSSSDVELMANEAVSESESLLSTNSIPPTGARLDVAQFSTVGTVSVPASVRKTCLTRQISSPLPTVLPIKEGNSVFGGRVVSNLQLPRIQRMSKEEQLFNRLEYLVPPDPFDELDRKKALYKYNIWNTSPDTNFDRIAHLAKLVFNTKGVTISLIDGGEIWHKSEWGLKVGNFLRSISLCGHVILQRGDEPMVVMDTHLDWRFMRNPLVIGGPRVRFYAGAPLRTQDGFNIGVLSLVDDTPREEFSPRQRHTLKEFAAIAMREMELWCDKIQLRIRDRIQTSMEQFSRECLEIDEESPSYERSDSVDGASMDKVYDRAAKLVLEAIGNEANISVTMHCGEPETVLKKQKLTTAEYHQLNVFFSKHPEGKIFEGIVPACFRSFLPTHIQYALTVPVYNIDKQLFALICAYNASGYSNRFLEGHELSYLRAIGVIILSAVLKRRMILADKAKSLFISNISHELRTPLHGILAAAELLGDTSLNPSQLSYLQTMEACGTSLVETVNHVLDFTKLNGNAKSGVPSSVHLLRLVEEAVDGCWVGYRARTAIMGDSGIGSVYSPPKEESGDSPVVTKHRYVETVIDIGYRREGWNLKCEKGGIRRVLMNLFGNSLKFTSDGYIHVMLHQLSKSEDDPPNRVKVELVVLDSGKGISQNFLKNQLFHPFSQENPLQTGTGLGLAIVSSIVTSEVVGGKVDVWSQEGVGTEIKVTFNAEVDDEFSELNDMKPIPHETGPLPVVSLLGFDDPHRGTSLLKRVFHSYLKDWWQFDVVTDLQKSNIAILNEEVGPVITATENHDTSRPFIILSAARGSPSIMHVATEHERVGGFCHILYKPGGPSRLRSILELAVRTSDSLRQKAMLDDVSSSFTVDETGLKAPIRNLEESHPRAWLAMAPRSASVSPALETVPSVSFNGNPSGREPNHSSPVSPPVLSLTNDPGLTRDYNGIHNTSHESGSRLLVGLPDPLTDASQRKPILEISGPQWFEDRSQNVEGTTPVITIPRSLQTTEISLHANPEAALLETGAAKITSSLQVVGPILDGHRKPREQSSSVINPSIPSVVSIGQSGTLLESSMQSEVHRREKRFRVLVVEDNSILRNLLTKWLSSKGYEFRHAVDGLAGVSAYNEEGPFDVVLLDLSMPVLDGVSAAAMIRKFERERQEGRRVRILALTGMSSLEDKRRAFSAGVDGYLIKPVAFKILDEMFHKMGLV